MKFMCFIFINIMCYQSWLGLKLRKAIRMRTAHYNNLKRAGLHHNHNMYMRTLYTRFTYIGNRNYVSYAYRVSNEFNSKNIKRQIKGHFNVFTNYLEKWQ